MCVPHWSVGCRPGSIKGWRGSSWLKHPVSASCLATGELLCSHRMLPCHDALPNHEPKVTEPTDPGQKSPIVNSPPKSPPLYSRYCDSTKNLPRLLNALKFRTKYEASSNKHTEPFLHMLYTLISTKFYFLLQLKIPPLLELLDPLALSSACMQRSRLPSAGQNSI